MKIRGGQKINHFFKKDGWTRQLISDLITNKKEFVNILRKIESKTSDRGEYYVVYDNHVIFDKEKIKQHEYVPFSIDGRKPCTTDKLFELKNKCE